MPTGWEYIRLSSIGCLNSGYTPKPEELSDAGIIPYFKIADMNACGNEKFLINTKSYLVSQPSRLFSKDSIVFPKNGGAVFTNKKRILAQDSVVDLNTAVFTPLNPIVLDYAYLMFLTIDFNDFYKGTALPTIKNEFITKNLYGLPPVAEQKRIVEFVETLLTEIDSIDRNQEDLKTLYSKFKSRALELAIQGKLVPQDPNDEPASVLLERIRAERKSNLGKKYVDSYIYKGDDNCYYEKVDAEVKNITEEIPFDIPENWAWVRLGTIFEHNTGKALNASNTNGIKRQYITTSNLYWDGFKLDNLREMLFTDDECEKYSVLKGDLLVCEGGDIGRAAVWNYDFSMCIQNHIHKLRPLLALNIDFFYYVFYSYKNAGLIGGKGIGIQGLSSKALAKILLPLPPKKEQECTINKINLLLDTIKGEV